MVFGICDGPGLVDLVVSAVDLCLELLQLGLAWLKFTVQGVE